MLTTVRLDPEGSREEPFVMTVTDANHTYDFDRRYATLDASWAAARRVGEAECDWLTIDGPGWNKCPACDGKGVMDAPLGAEHPVCLECGGRGAGARWPRS